MAAVVLPTPAGPNMKSLSRLVTASGFLARSAMGRLRSIRRSGGRFEWRVGAPGTAGRTALVRLMLGFVWAVVNRKIHRPAIFFRPPYLRLIPCDYWPFYYARANEKIGQS